MLQIILNGNFSTIWRVLLEEMREAPRVEQSRWQGVDVSKDPSARTYALHNVCFEVDLKGIEDLAHWREDIQPNLPWADNHFLERVGGEPLNPGQEWRNWPWAVSADRHRDLEGVFNHTYMERLWPKFARRTVGGELPNRYAGEIRRFQQGVKAHRGIAWEYGDLQDLVELLVKDPWTRQAWIPLFFPEDTGWSDGGRKPCTLGYQFLRTGDRLCIWYPLRSCDLARHFRDDCYLAVRLLLWVLQQCRKADGTGCWESVIPGAYSMWVTHLHIFENDRRELGLG